MEYLFGVDAGSFRLEARELDDLRPLLGFVGDQLPEVGIRERKYRDAHVGKPRLDLGISEASIDLAVELLNNRDWRVPGSDNARPAARLKARHRFSDRRNVRKL